jgi:hypothetical protein
VNCRANNRNNNNFESHTQRGYSRRPSETQRRSYNRFESLSTKVECYKCKILDTWPKIAEWKSLLKNLNRITTVTDKNLRLLVEDMKHNLLSVIQMCDQGHKVTFDSQKCEIRREGSGKLVGTAARTSNNIYVLSEIGNEKCFLGKEDESWLWHRRMGHIHFDNLVKVIKREAVREMSQITKPTNTLCKHCQQGNQTRPGSNQRNIQQQDHWKLCILI